MPVNASLVVPLALFGAFGLLYGKVHASVILSYVGGLVVLAPPRRRASRFTERFARVESIRSAS